MSRLSLPDPQETERASNILIQGGGRRWLRPRLPPRPLPPPILIGSFPNLRGNIRVASRKNLTGCLTKDLTRGWHGGAFEGMMAVGRFRGHVRIAYRRKRPTRAGTDGRISRDATTEGSKILDVAARTRGLENRIPRSLQVGRSALCWQNACRSRIA